ncbi:HAD family phosphatase [bacterium CPR1]|nr:HAD family phosphatase [bacterium CPR1]
MEYGAIFDMDGVLVDSHESHFAAWNELGRRHGVPFELPLFERTFGSHNAQILPVWLGREVSPEELENLAGEKEELFRAHVREHIHPLPGARELVEALASSGFKLAVGSSGPRQNVELLLTGLGIRQHFDALVTGDDVTEGKPNPQVFSLAAEALGLPPARCLVVEDAPQGVEAGLAAGSLVVAVTSTRSASDLASAHRVVDSLTSLNPNLFQEWLDGWKN